jgi:hypothetical protein
MSSAIAADVTNNALYGVDVQLLIKFESQTSTLINNPLPEQSSFLPDTTSENQGVYLAL